MGFIEPSRYDVAPEHLSIPLMGFALVAGVPPWRHHGFQFP